MQKKPAYPVKVLLLGGIILDRYFEVERYPKAGGDTLIQNSFDRVGGCSLNVAITLKNLGVNPCIVTKLGDDESGRKIEHYVDSQGLSKTCMLKAPGRGTGYCLTILEKIGERTFFTYKGCEGELSLDEFPPGTFEGFAFAYITGYYLANRQTAAAVIELSGKLRQAGCQVVFDPGALVTEMDPFHLRQLVQLSDWLVPNTHELALIQRSLGLSEEPSEWPFDQGVRALVVKKGSQGVAVYSPNSSFTMNSLPIRSKDTTGAGDSFAGGLIYGLTQHYPLFDAVSLANACGAFTSTLIGPHGEFSLQDILDLMASFKE